MIQSDELTALDALPTRTAVVDRDGTIVSVNQAWKTFAEASGLRTPNFGVGAYYLQYADWSDDRALRLREEFHQLLDGKIDLLTHSYPCDANGSRQWFVMLGVALSRHERAGAALMHVDLTPWLPSHVVLGGAPLRAHDPALTQQVLLRALSMGALAPVLAPMGQLETGARASGPSIPLSARQAEVFALIGEGKTNQEIAAALGISLNTVKLHVSAILRRLDLASRTQIALLASRRQNG